MLPEDVRARLQAVEQGQNIHTLNNPPPSPATATVSQGLTSLADHAESLISALAQDDGIKLGLSEIDVLTRGFRAQDLVMVVGYSHQGKTQLTLNLVVNNPDKRILFISLDDPAEMILCKLVAMQTGYPAEQIEQYVRAGDQQVCDLVRRCADEVFTDLIIHDERVSVEQLPRIVGEAEAALGGPLDALIIDYLDLLKGITAEDEFASTKRKADALKGFATKQDFPTICLHQGSRANSRPGAPITIMSAAFGGEQQATVILGVRRKRDDPSLELSERQAHQDSVTLHVVKNKRPGGRLTFFGGKDFWMDPETGRIRPFSHGPRQPVASGYTGGQ
jgi:replicative DNA helicase